MGGTPEDRGNTDDGKSGLTMRYTGLHLIKQNCINPCQIQLFHNFACLILIVPLCLVNSVHLTLYFSARVKI
jgi:hypothetical protein